MGEFAYVAPTSVADAIGVLQEHARSGRRAQALAGGTDLLVQLRGADKAPRTIVDVKKIEETNRLDIGSDEIYIGAAIPSALLNENAELKALLPGLVEAADLIGSSQIQGRATLGGNLCNASPAADTTPAMIANRGVCVIASGGGSREMPVEAFCTGVWRRRQRLGRRRVFAWLEVPAPSGVHRGRLPALHPAHRNGHRRGGLRGQPDP